MKATISINGLFCYDNTVFDELVLPEDIDKETLVNLITAECAEMELLYPSAPYLKQIIGKWSAAMLPGWNRALKALTAEYNPLENYDRYEETHDAGEESNGNVEHVAGKTTEDRTPNLTSTTDHKKIAFDINQYDKERQEVTNQTGSDNMETNVSNWRENNETKNNSAWRVSHIHGNIGVTTADQLIAGALETAKKTVYGIIVNDFKNRFCLLVY